MTALGHELSVNVATGGLVITASDLSIPYHDTALQIVRSLDSQDQYGQTAYLRSHPNTDPRLRFFGNWQFHREADVTPSWPNTHPELLISDPDVSTRLFYRQGPDFYLDSQSAADTEGRLRAYGIPGRTLASLGWQYSRHDFLLRTRRGAFAVLTGRLEAESLVDPVNLRLWAFEPARGIGRKYTSKYAYERFIDADDRRERNARVLISDITDPLGHMTSFAPIAAVPPYRAYRLSDGSGRSFRLDLEDYFTYLDGDRPGGEVKTYFVSSVLDETRAASNTITYEYDGGRLAQVTYPGFANGGPRLVQYRYDERGNLVEIADPTGDTFHIDYLEDFADSDEHLIPRLKVSRLADSDGNSVSYEYDHGRRLVTVTIAAANQPPHTVTYIYAEDDSDTRQRFITSEEIEVRLGQPQPQRVHTEWQYSTDGRFLPIAAVDPLGATSRSEYNDFNQVVRTIDATGHSRDVKYDLTPNPTPARPNRYDLIEITEENVDVNGNVFAVQSAQTFRTYDATTSPDPADVTQSTHRVASQTDELGNVTQFEYDDPTSFFPLNPTVRIDPSGQTSRRTYDASGGLLSATDPLQSERRWRYNRQGQVLTYTDPNGFSHHWVYDPGTGWLTDVTDALGAAPGDPAHTIRYDWNDGGRPIRETSAVGTVTEFAYLANQRLASITHYDPAPHRISLTYEVSGALGSITDPNGNTTRFLYDEAGRLYQTFRDRAPNAAIIFVRDPAGRVGTLVDRNGLSTQYDHDAVGRVVAVREANWPATAPVNQGKVVGLRYDRLGRVLVVTDSELPNPAYCVYDAAGNLKSKTDHFGWELRRSYDDRNALVRLYDPDGVLDLRFTRDAAGNIATVRDSAQFGPSRTFTYIRRRGQLVDNLYGIEANPPGLTTRFEYDRNRHLTAISSRVRGVAAGDFSYAYDADARIRAIAGDHQARYDYDGLKRLIRESDVDVRDSYDGTGNRLWRARAAAQVPNVYDPENRLTNSPATGEVFVYDANGNLLSIQGPGGAGVRFTYDGANRLAAVDDGARLVEYLYDPSGRLLERKETSGGRNLTERYRRAGEGIVITVDGRGRIRLLYTVDDRGRILRRRSDNPLRPAPGSDPRSLFVLHDGLRSVCRLVDSDGSIRLEADYDAWGNETVNGRLDPPERHGYRQGYTDSSTGLLNFGRRWYDPALGRWISQDPVVTELSIDGGNLTTAVSEIVNLYAYVGNDPLNVADLTGLGDLIDRIKNTILGKVLEAWIRGRDIDRRTMRPKGTASEQVEKKQPKTNEPAPTAGPEPAPSAGSETAKYVGIGVGVGVGAVTAWETAKWVVAIVGVPFTEGVSLSVLAIP